jgi:hypothetical protein
MSEIRTGNSPLYYAGNGPGIAQNRAILSLFGTLLGPGEPGARLAISHFKGPGKSFVMRGLQVVWYNRHYVNKLCRI